MTSAFELLPAIDLRGGRVVRLQQGDFARETAYADDPEAVARAFVADGARWLHVVDLDGAGGTAPKQHGAIARILAAAGGEAQVEVAGGLRDEAAVDAALDGGAARAVVGTAALADPAFARRLVDRHGADRIAVALDVRDGQAVGHGWRADAPGVDVERALSDLSAVGIRTFEVTAIDRDGLLGSPDLDLYRRLIALDRGAIVASAGIATIADLLALRDLGCAGAIVGRALYEGRFTLRKAMAAIG
jgi:phosphoribosylformimino-5-aminoimidazole carboxamide ribotide isomerase